MNRVHLTVAELDAMRPHVALSSGAWETVEAIIAARQVAAVDRERAAWATKVQEVIATAFESDHWTSGTQVVRMRDLRALLAADDAEAQRDDELS